jgi:hypothetical protein
VASIGQVPRRVLRSWPTTLGGLAASATAAAAGVWGLASGGNVVGYALLTAVGVAGLLLSARVGVVVDASGLHLRGVAPTRVLPWDTVEDIDCDLVAMHGLFGRYAPVITTRDSDEPLVAGVLGSYRREIAEQRGRDLRVAAALRSRVKA